MRRAAKVDVNQAEIVKALRKIGATVQPLHTVGHGCPDLLVGFQGENHLFEVKDGSLPASRRILTEDEAKWANNWRGTVRVIKSVDEAIEAITL